MQQKHFSIYKHHPVFARVAISANIMTGIWRAPKSALHVDFAGRTKFATEFGELYQTWRTISWLASPSAVLRRRPNTFVCARDVAKAF
jgi:hypothetical protein